MTTETVELHTGVRKTLSVGPYVLPYYSVGVGLVHARRELSFFGGSGDSSPCAYAECGILYLVYNSFVVGVNAHFTFGTVISLDDLETDADSYHIGIMAGWRVGGQSDE